MSRPETQRRILELMEAKQAPLTVKDLTTLLAPINHMTIRNHLKALIKTGEVVKDTYKIGLSEAFILGTYRTPVARVKWGSDIVSLIDKLRQWDKRGGIPNDLVPNTAARVVIDLFKMAAYALDDDPTPISNHDLKLAQNRLAQLNDLIESYRQLIKGLLEMRQLWDRQELPRYLIMNDPDTTIEEVINLIDNLTLKLSE